MDFGATLGPSLAYEGAFGATLGSLWCHFGVTLEPFGGHFGYTWITLGTLGVLRSIFKKYKFLQHISMISKNCGVSLGSLWGHFGTTFGI